MSEKNDPFAKLKNLSPAPAGPDAKSRAHAAAMAAFDLAQEKKQKRFQGFSLGARLTSIFTSQGRWTMNTIRIPLGIAAAGLLLFPLTMQLINSSGLTSLEPGGGQSGRFTSNMPANGTPDDAGERDQDLGVDTVAPLALAEEERAETEPMALAEGLMSDQSSSTLAGANKVAREVAVGGAQSLSMAAQPAGSPAFSVPMEPPAAMPSPASGDQFSTFDDNGFKLVSEAPVSTFSIDVDTASYAYVRRMLEMGQLPQPDAVRAEEMINYFSYDYAAPKDAQTPFGETVSVFPTPWNKDTLLMHVGIKGFVPDTKDAAPANIVLLIDTSGSMNEPDKLPLLKRSFALLIDQLSERDHVSIVTYAGSAGVVLEPTPASEKGAILAALNGLQPGGSTAGAAGIEAAYQLAAKAASEGSNNRVLLATDGDFNVGISDPGRLKRLIESKRDAGIFLSVLGFGSGNYQDTTMQTLAQNGNGTASYIDSFREAQKVLASEARGTLTTIAKDVKIQVEFNPASVAEYRLIGYETRALNREDFNNDRVDAGDIGAGHSVTAIYEFTPSASAARQIDPLRYQDEPAAQPADRASADEYAFLKLRYKLPDATQSILVTQPVPVDLALPDFSEAPEDARFATAVAAFAQKLRGGGYVDALSYADIRALAADARGEDESGYRSEFISLVDMAASLTNGQGQ